MKYISLTLNKIIFKKFHQEGKHEKSTVNFALFGHADIITNLKSYIFF